MVFLKRAFLTLVAIIFVSLSLNSPDASARPSDSLIKEYERLSAIDRLYNCTANFKDSTNPAPESLSIIFSEHRRSSLRWCGPTVSGGNGEALYSIMKRLGEGWVESSNSAQVTKFMNTMGYTWNGEKSTWIKPNDDVFKKNILKAFNQGKSINLETPKMKWVKGYYYLHNYCQVDTEIQGPPNNYPQYADAARKGVNLDDAWGFNWSPVIVKDITKEGTLEEVLYRVYARSNIAWNSSTDDSCRQYAKIMSEGADAVAKENNTAKRNTAKTTTDTIVNGIASDICKAYPEGREQEYCQQTAATKVRTCYNIRRGSLDDDFLRCLRKEFTNKEAQKLFTDDWLKQHQEKGEAAGKNDLVVGADPDQAANQPQPTCTIEGIGWILCPVMKFIAGINDALFSMISSFLTIDKDISDTSKPAFKAWSLFRNIANGLFAVAFLMVIFSQITSAGLSNYSIKQITPRLIMASIFINASFYICQVAIDLSNIFGVALKQSLESIAGGVSTGGWEPLMETILIGGGVSAVVTALAIYAIGIPGAIAFLVATVMTVMILTGRKAGVILLTVLSPLAFVAWILPNTERWFKQWAKMFIGLLVVFPVISLLFGAGTLASSIIGSQGDLTMKIAALVATAIPLFATPTLLKKSMESLGSIGQVAGSLSGKLSGVARNSVANSDYMKHRERVAEEKRARINAGDYDGGKLGKLNPQRWRSRMKGLRNNNALFNRVTHGYGERLSLQGAAVAAAQDKEAMEAANASVSAMNLDSAGLMQLIRTGKDRSGKKITEHQRRAAVQQLAPMMTGNEARGLASLSTRLDTDMRKEIASAVRTASTKAPWLGGKSLSDIQAGIYNEDAAMDSYIQEKLSAEDFNTMDAASIDALNQRAIVQARMGNGALLFNLRGTKVVHSQSNELTSKISASNRSALRRIS